jgi:hypothetical protein
METPAARPSPWRIKEFLEDSEPERLLEGLISQLICLIDDTFPLILKLAFPRLEAAWL